MATRLPGYRRLAGSARKYATPTGETITYRAYRKALEAAGAVQHLDPADLANVRRRQRDFKDIVDQMVKVRAKELDARIEYAEELGEEEELEDLREERRTLRRSVIQSGVRKNALADLKKHHHKKNPESFEATVNALKALGRRGGIPDWVPPDLSDAFRRGKLRRDRLPAAFKAYRQTDTYQQAPRRAAHNRSRRK